jgi:hypothetical protein
MNMTTEPTEPTMKVAKQIIAKIILKASMAGLCNRSWSAPVVAGFWATISRMMKRTTPSSDARRRNMNFLAVRQGWTNARTKVVAAREANSTPGGLSSIPTAVATIADKPQITRRINDQILLRGVESASIMIILFQDSEFRLLH